MRALLLLLFLAPSLSFAGAFELYLSQRNIANTATLTRTVPPPMLGVDSVLGLNQWDNLPTLWKLGPCMAILNNELTCGPEWTAVVNKPFFATVATSGDYNDLINKPSGSQVNSDWLSTSGPSEILNRPALASVATSGAYSDLSGQPTIPAAQVQSDWNAVSAPAAILNKPSLFSGAYSSLTGIPSSFAPAAHNQAWTTITSTPTTLSGYGITDGVTTTTLGAYATTASVTAGLATKFNSPTGSTAQYLRGDGSLATFPALSSGTVTSVTAGTGLSGGTITSSGTISMPSVGTAGSYSGVTTDAQGRVTAGTNRSQSAATRTLNTVFQVSATRDALVNYSVQCTITASIAGGQSCDVVLEIATDAAFTAGVQTVGIIGTGQTYTLAIALQGVQPQTAQVTGYVPAGYYARLRTVNVSGSPVYSYRAGQEILQ